MHEHSKEQRGKMEPWQTDLDVYIRQGEPGQAQRSAAWKAAIGLQAVDGLKTSDYLLETAKQHIEGAISISDAQRRIESYYENRSNRLEVEQGDREADVVSSRITELLQERAFRFSPIELQQIHRRLFEGTIDHAGKYRACNISKREWVLNGASVIYAPCDSLRDTLEYDFGQESNFSYKGLSMPEIIKRITKFTAGVWQIHPFCEGNTRTTAVFIVKYLRTLGFEPDHTQFADNSWYFRNALVRANYNDIQNGIHETNEFLERFFENLLAGANHVLKNRFMHIDYDGSLKESVQDIVKTVQVNGQDIAETEQVSAPDNAKTEQVGAKSAKLVDLMGDGEYTAVQLMTLIGMKHRGTFMKNYIDPAIEAGLIERTVPEKPQSRNQRYRKVRR